MISAHSLYTDVHGITGDDKDLYNKVSPRNHTMRLVLDSVIAKPYVWLIKVPPRLSHKQGVFMFTRLPTEKGCGGPTFIEGWVGLLLYVVVLSSQ